MLRRFAGDKRGNFSMMMVIATVPILGGLALAVDYTEVSRQRQIVLNALDAANVATGAHIISGSVSSVDPVAYEAAIKKYAQDFFVANLGPVDPSKTTLSVVLPNNDAGGGTLQLSATLNYKPYFLPTFAELIGRPRPDGVDVAAKSEVRLKNTLEVALVLDNSGSMSQYGTGTGQQRITLLKAAAKQLIETMSNQAAMMKQVPKPVQFGLVPFSASVNIAPANDDQPWMDTKGISPVHHENFDWSKMTPANPNYNPNKYAEKVGDVWYKRGADWGDTRDQPLTRFSLYADIIAETDREAIPNTSRRVCKRFRDGACKEYTTEPEYEYTVSQYTSWQGCVEARPAPYNNNDAEATSSNPATLFVPMFAPDEARHLWRDLDNDNIPDLDDTSFGYGNNWWADWEDSGATSRQSDMRKYFRVKPYDAPPADGGDGPNSSCTTNAITPLHDVTTTEGKKVILDAIDAMAPTGNTNVPEGTAWGWRVVSHKAPFTEGRPDIEKGNDKVVIVLTDGANTYGDYSYTDPAGNQSTYAAYGYTGKGYNGTSTTRMFMDTSGSVGKSTYTNTNYQAAMDEQMQMVCANAKAPDQGNVIMVTVSLDLSTSVASEKKAIEALTKCASDSRFKKNADGTPKKLFYNATGSNLADKFKEIADELSNLRIVG